METKDIIRKVLDDLKTNGREQGRFVDSEKTQRCLTGAVAHAIGQSLPYDAYSPETQEAVNRVSDALGAPRHSEKITTGFVISTTKMMTPR